MVVKTTSVFSPEEAQNIPRIADDPNVVWSVFRDKSYDVVMVYLRIFHFWADIWNNRQIHSNLIIDSIERKKAKVKKLEGRKKRRRK